MKVEKTSIYLLAQQVLKGKLNLSKALQRVASEDILAQFDNDCLNQLDDYIRKLAERDLDQAIIMGVLTCWVARHRGSDVVWGNCNNALGGFYLRQEKLELALYHYQEAFRAFGQISKAQETIVQIRLDIGEIKERQGDLEAARVEYKAAVRLATGRRSSELKSDAYNGLGSVYLALGKADKALKRIQCALKLSSEAEDSRGHETALGNMGLVYHFLGRREEAAEYHKKAVELSRKIDHQAGLGRHLNNLGGVLLEQGKLAEAKEHLLEAVTIARQLRDRAGEQQRLGNLGNVYQARAEQTADPSLRRRWLEMAQQHHHQAMAIASERDDRRSQADHQLNLGNVYRNLKHFHKAEACYARAFALAQEQDLAETRWRIHYARGNLCEVQQQDQQAFKHYAAAIEIVERQRSQLIDLELRTKFWQERTALYKRMVLCCLRLEQPTYQPEQEPAFSLPLILRRLRQRFLAQAEQHETWFSNGKSLESLSLDKMWLALAYTEQAKARYLADLLAQSSGQAGSTQEAVAIASKPIDQTLKTIEVAIEGLPESTAVVVFNVTEAGTVIFIVTNQPGDSATSVTETHWQISADGRIRARLVEGFNQESLRNLLVQLDDAGEAVGGYMVDYYANFTQWREATLKGAGREIYQALLAPVQSELKQLQVKALILMPNLGLSLFPLHTCGPERDYLLDYYDIIYAPSFSMLHYCQQQAHLKWREERRFFAVANPERDDPENNLMWADFEVEGICAFFSKDQTQVLDSRERKNWATQQAVVMQMPDYTYIHFACHGTFDLGDPLKSALSLFQREPLSLETLLKSPEQSKLAKVHLVMMSACETGLVDPSDLADEYISLPAGFLLAGASAVISTLWQVSDFSTAMLSQRFYLCHLQGDPDHAEEGPLPPVQALRRAQLWLRDLTLEEFSTYVEQQKAQLKPMLWGQLKKRQTALLREYNNDYSARPFAHPYYWAAFTFIGA